MKKIYLSPEIEIENINLTNIIATSVGPVYGGDDQGLAGDDADSKIIDFDEDVDIEW